MAMILALIYFHKNNIFYTKIAAFYGTVSTPIKNYYDSKKNVRCVDKIGQNIQAQNIEYNFFIAGHAYGNPYSSNLGMHPSFFNYLKNSNKQYDFAIFAGDITRTGEPKYWDLFKRELDYLNIKKYFVAPGNHDIGIHSERRKMFKEYFNDVNYSFVYKNDLFIIINGYEHEWSIKKEQLDFLVNILEKEKSNVNNVFIISHPAIFYKDNMGIKVNSLAGKGNKLNFWKMIFPILKKFELNYFIISGDLGAHKGQELFCRKDGKFHFLGTGMGAGSMDNFLEFNKINKNFKAKAIFF